LQAASAVAEFCLLAGPAKANPRSRPIRAGDKSLGVKSTNERTPPSAEYCRLPAGCAVRGGAAQVPTADPPARRRGRDDRHAHPYRPYDAADEQQAVVNDVEAQNYSWLGFRLLLLRDNRMQVSYEVRSSQWGQGIFTTQPIRKGQLIWDVKRAKCKTYDDAQARTRIAELHRAAPCDVRQLLEYAYWCPTTQQLVDLSMDDGRFFNHGDAENVSH
jgi:hypothetical protein